MITLRFEYKHCALSPLILYNSDKIKGHSCLISEIVAFDQRIKNRFPFLSVNGSSSVRH